MKFFENHSHYDYPFPAVTLAFFLRYPNPYSRHVLTADVLDRHVDPRTQRLHTTRLLLKRSKVPAALLKLLPAGFGGTDIHRNPAGQSYILETSVVDVREGWMQTESRNMEWTGVLSVVERQDYHRQQQQQQPTTEGEGGGQEQGRRDQSESAPKGQNSVLDLDGSQRTAVNTTVTFRSRLGHGVLTRRKADSHHHQRNPQNVDDDSDGDDNEGDHRRSGLLASWSTAGLQRTVELIGLRRTRDAVFRSKQGMDVVLERLRHGGVVAVLEGMRRDHEAAGLGGGGGGGHAQAHTNEGRWRRIWARGAGNESNNDGNR